MTRPSANPVHPSPDTADVRCHDAYVRLLRRIAAEGCRGYDPYDALNTRHAFLKASRPVRLALTYFNKFSPVNFRPLLGIPRTMDNHGVALIVRALLKTPPPPGIDLPVEPLVEHLVSRTLVEQAGYHSWNGLTFPLQMRNQYYTPDVPGVIGTEAVAGALLQRYLRTGEERLREMVLSARAYFLDVLLTRYEGAVFFRYKTSLPEHACTYNASVVAAGFVIRTGTAFGLDDHHDVIREVYGFLASRQQADGSWNYSVDLRTGREKPQIDFHQGFMLDGFLDCMEAGLATPQVEAAYERGLAFYRTRQFTPEGRGLYRYPRPWPVNIHNQAQGILTFTRAGERDPAHRDFARTVADWTIRHMQAPDGHFYYLRYPFFTNRIGYMRWGNAAMAHALATHLSLSSGAPASRPGEPSDALMPPRAGISR